jgi:hypothetical protein
MKLLSPLIVLFLLGGSSLSNTPEDAANKLYSIVLTIPKWGVPSEDKLHLLAPYMSKRLTALFRNALAYREKFIKDNPPQFNKDGISIQDKPPFCDGDVFSSSFEGATKFAIGKSSILANKYRIILHLELIDPTRPNEPFKWTDAIYVIKEDGRFVVDDMEFLGTWDFGNHGLLSQSLKF